ECFAPLAAQRPVVLQGGLEQYVRSDDVGLDELGRAVDRSVDVALGGEMEHGVGSEIVKQLSESARVSYIRLGEAIARIAGHFGFPPFESAGKPFEKARARLPVELAPGARAIENAYRYIVRAGCVVLALELATEEFFEHPGDLQKVEPLTAADIEHAARAFVH